MPPSFFEEAGVLRNKLLCYRFENYQSIKPGESELTDLEPRRAQISAAIYAVASEPFRSEFIAWVKKQELEERAEKPQSWVALAILNLASGNGFNLSVKDVAIEAQSIRQCFDPDLVIGDDALSAVEEICLLAPVTPHLNLAWT